MGKYDFSKLIDRKGTYSAKWDSMPQGNEADALPLWVADMDFPCADPIIKALHERVDKMVFGYTIYDNADLKNAVSGWYKKRYGWQVKNEDIFYCPGVVPAVSFMINILSDEGDGIIIQPPVYHPFRMGIEANKRSVVNNPLIYDKLNGRYEIDYDDLDKKFAEPKNKGLVLCHPHNPVGRVWTEDELKKVIALAKKHRKWIVSDEIHADLVRKGVKFIPAAMVAGDYADEIITLTAPSKAFNIASLKMSNLVITKKEYQDAYMNLAGSRFHVTGVSPLAIAATVAAYNEGEEWLGEVNEYIDGNIDYCMEFFKKELPDSVPIYIEGTYLFWVDLNGYISDKDEQANVMRKKAKVALNDGYIFGEEGSGFQRINVACPRSILEDCLNRMKAALVS